MTCKHVMWVISIIIGVVAMAAGVAVIVNRFLVNKNNNEYEYIDCEDDAKADEKEKTEEESKPEEAE